MDDRTCGPGLGPMIVARADVDGEVPGFPVRLSEWLADYVFLLDVIGALRDRGFDATDLEPFLESPAVARLRLEWEVWEELVIGSSLVADRRLRRHLDPSVIRSCRWALWGEPGGAGAGRADRIPGV